MTLPLAVTMGDPAGIGGEMTLAAWHRAAPTDRPFYVVDDLDRIRTLSARIGLSTPAIEISTPEEAIGAFPDALPVIREPLRATQTPGLPEPKNAEAAIRSIEVAVSHARSGEAAAVVTNPINKKALYDGAQFAYPGHTEFLASLGEVDRTVMMLAAPVLKVVPVTIHVSLRDACRLLSTDLIVETARIVDADLKRFFGIHCPRIAVSGLNPHAGEGGTMGREEIDIIAPAIEILNAEGITAIGPLPGDTMFHETARAGYDVALCMYHDQALIPLKALDFAKGVNITLGLPFIRTSPDHGTAYGIAGTGTADPSSFIEALRVADGMARANG